MFSVVKRCESVSLSRTGSLLRLLWCSVWSWRLRILTSLLDMLIFPFILLDFASYNPAAYLCFVFLRQPKKYVGVFLASSDTLNTSLAIK